MKLIGILLVTVFLSNTFAKDLFQVYRTDLGPGFSEYTTGVRVNIRNPSKAEKIKALKKAKKEIGFSNTKNGKIVLLLDKHIHYIRGIGYGGGHELVYGYIDTKGDIYLNELSRSEEIFVFAGIWNYYRGVSKYCSIPSEVEGCYYDEKKMHKDIQKKYGINSQNIHHEIIIKSKFKKVSP